MLQLHWLPSPTLPKEPEQCWQICLHVFIIIKNVKDPSSQEAQQIPLITFLSPLHLQSFCILSLSFFPPYPCAHPPGLFVGGGNPSLSFSELGGSLGVSNDGWEFHGNAGRKQLSEGRPLPQGGSYTPASRGERKSLGNKEKILSPANERRSRQRTLAFQYLAFLPFLTLLFSTT